MPKRYRSLKYKKSNKRKKYVTKRGVKALIAKNAIFAGPNYRYFRSNTGHMEFSFGQRGVTSVGVNIQSQFQTMWGSYIINTVNSVTTGGAGQPPTQSSNYAMATKNGFARITFHNPWTEVVQARFWICDAIQDNTASASSVWTTDYAEDQSDTTATMNFADNMLDYPTYWKEFNAYWKITKKYKVAFRPGDTKIIEFKIPSGVYRNNDSFATMKGLTRYIMIEAKGVPTHHNDGVTPSTGDISYTEGGLEWIIETRQDLRAISQVAPVDWVFGDDNKGTVTAAKSIIPDQSTTIANI